MPLFGFSSIFRTKILVIWPYNCETTLEKPKADSEIKR